MSGGEAAFAAWLHGEDDPAQLSEVRGWLAADPAHVQAARSELAIHLGLRARLQPAGAVAVAELLAEVRAARQPVHTTQRHRLVRRCVDDVGRRRRRRRLPVVLAIAAGLLLAGLAALTWNAMTPPAPAQASAIGRIASLRGDGQVERDGVPRPLLDGDALRAGDELSAAPGAVIAWSEGASRIELRGGRCRVPSSADDAVALRTGLLRIAAAPAMPEVAQLRIDAASTTIQASDAELLVSVSGAAARCDVIRGQARVGAGGSERIATPAAPVFSEGQRFLRVLVSYDQAGPAPQPRVAYGEPIADPDCADGWALHGVMLDGSREVYLDRLDEALPGMPADAELRFAYRVAGRGPLRVFAHNIDQRCDVMVELGEVSASAWQVARVRIADFRRPGPPQPGPGVRAGERLRNLVIASDRPGTLLDLRVDAVVVLGPE